MLFRAPTEALTLLFTVSTLAFLGIFASLVRAGLAMRREVGRLASASLFWLLGIAFQLSLRERAGDVTAPEVWIVPGVLLAGGTLCFGLAERHAPRSRRRWLVVAAMIRGFLLLLVSDRFDALGMAEATVPELQAWLQAHDDTSQVDELAMLVANLEAAGVEVPDLASLRAGARARLDSELAIGTFNGFYVPAMSALGLLADADYARLRDEPRFARLIAPTANFVNFHAALGPVAVETHFQPLSADARERLVERVLAQLDPNGKYANNEELRTIVWLFERVGADERSSELQPVVETVLRATWSPTLDGRQAAFAPYRGSIERDDDGHSTEPRLTFVWGHSTATAVWLMARFGVPDFVDLGALDAYLHEQSFYWKSLGVSPYVGEAVATRALLHELPGWHANARERAPTWFDQLIGVRVLAGALLLVGFAVLLTIRAPESAN